MAGKPCKNHCSCRRHQSYSHLQTKEGRRRIGEAVRLRRIGKPRESGAAAKGVATARANGTLQRNIENLANLHRGKPLSKEHGRKIAASNRRRSVSSATREKASLRFRKMWREGRGSPLVGTARRHYRSDLRCTFRSSWEANVARVFNTIGLVWKYEPRRFSLPSGKSYCPDFQLETGAFIEVKGFLRQADADRMDEFRGAYPEEKLYMIGQETYYRMRLKWSHLPGWEL